ncbi:MAG: hypothetical protein ACYDDB_06485 [bacterium]
MLLKDDKSFREKGSELRHRFVDAIYDRIPVEVVEHLGNANKEFIFAIEGIFNSFVKRIDNRIAKTKERHSKTGGNENQSKENSEEE